jgi:hypothetical protein
VGNIPLLGEACLGKQLTSKQASRGLPNRAIKQAEGCFACLLASLDIIKYVQARLKQRRDRSGWSRHIISSRQLGAYTRP